MNTLYLDTAIKLAIGLLTLIVVINISGKSNLAPNSATDQIQNYVLGGIIGGVIYNPSITLLQYVIILMIWTILVLCLKWLKTHNHTIKQMIDGQPRVLIQKGQVDVEACRTAGLTAADLTLKLRGQGIFRMADVKRAVLEQNGQLIVVQAGEANPKYPVITDGVVQTDILELLEKDPDWLQEELQQLGYADISQIFLVEYDQGQLNIVTYES
ncbi:DUF421 domain-containing protein [Streptococcus danieliae]|uniref:DUF421 domain-containing protein n=1 Tax=Streptococcus danieliae TaxID=747656 RepID=A0A7Z0LDD7_9STRE|nr:DUF421 domain-containing protein [Streptococcus danieliae]MBF0717281.1 DUF421 domain-containing protein [Streptococcus danieliae]MVX59584.1 DUF421 domain-containing protein [Streptococcus danieliae]NYS49211.1 DUF421 domain-containing protein [Streptococcus danieliae]